MDPTPSSAPGWFDYAGQRWYLRKKYNHYTNRHGELLHRAVWSDAHGDIPDDHVIHHVDHDPTNNSLANLVCIPGSEHQAHHAISREDRAWLDQQKADARSAASRALWDARRTAGPRQYVCQQCGNVFETIAMRAKFCGATCRNAFYGEHYRSGGGRTPRERAVESTCAVCGEMFRSVEVRAKFCSNKCRRRSANAEKRAVRDAARASEPEKRVCPDCGGNDFAGRRIDAVYCSRDCQTRHNRLYQQLKARGRL